MSWKTFLFFASACMAANHSLRADEIVRTNDPPVIVHKADYDRYEVLDNFLVKRGVAEGQIRSLETLFPQMNEVTTPKERPPLVQGLIESTKQARQQTASKPKLTVVVQKSDQKNAALSDDLEPEEIAANEFPDKAAHEVKREKYSDFADDENSSARKTTTRSSRHFNHHRYHKRDAHGHQHHRHEHQHHQHHDVTRKLRERWFLRFNLP